ncbi:hypothetical protein CR513_06583, partial [Mucuna pruriens]
MLESYGIKDYDTLPSKCLLTYLRSTPTKWKMERKHKHILNGECVLTSYQINQIPSYLLQGKSPYELLFRKLPTYNQLNFFREMDKFHKRNKKCVFMGYPHGKKRWRVYDLETGAHLVPRVMMFHENVFSYVMEDYVTYTIRCLKDPTCTQTHSKSSFSDTTPYPIANYVTSAKFSLRYRALLAIVIP